MRRCLPKPARQFALITSIFAVVLLDGCNVGPKYNRPAAEAPAAYKEAPPQNAGEADWKMAQPIDNPAPEKWWEIFNDSELNEFEEQADKSNQSIASAVAAFTAA